MSSRELADLASRVFVEAEASGGLDDMPGVAQQDEYAATVQALLASRRAAVTNERCWSFFGGARLAIALADAHVGERAPSPDLGEQRGPALTHAAAVGYPHLQEAKRER